MVTNSDGDTGRFKILCDWEHDDPEQAPGYRVPVFYEGKPLVRIGDALVTEETAIDIREAA
jgi:hypothetical protein